MRCVKGVIIYFLITKSKLYYFKITPRHTLAAGAKRGRVVDVRPGYLKFSTRSHMIYFRDHGDRLEIMRILHGRQDVERHL